MRKLKFILCCAIAMMMLSCEGFKVLKLYNFSETDVEVTIKPGFEQMKYHEISDYPSDANSVGDSLSIVLRKDSALVLTSIFTSFLMGSKLKEYDIRINYLKIKKNDTTIIANSKREILELTKEDQFKYKRKLDKERELVTSRNYGGIIIRK